MMRAWMIEVVLVLLVGSAFSASQLPRYGLSYALVFSMEDGKLTCPKWSIIDGDGRRYDVLESGADYTFSALDKAGNELYSFKFQLFSIPAYAAPREFFDDQGNQIYFGNRTAPPQPRLRSGLDPPYHPNATRLRVSDLDGTVLLEIDVSKYAHLDWQAIKRNRDEFYRNQANQSGGGGPANPPVNWTEAFYGLLILLAGGAILVIGILVVMGAGRWAMRRIRPADKKTEEESGVGLEKREEENGKKRMEKKGLKKKKKGRL